MERYLDIKVFDAGKPSGIRAPRCAAGQDSLASGILLKGTLVRYHSQFRMASARFLICFLSVFLIESSADVTFNPLPTRVIGQNSLQVTNLNPNLVEGREFLNPTAIAIDASMSPPALYVS